MRKRYPEKYKEFLQFEAFGKTPFDNLTGLGIANIKPKEELLVPMYTKDGMPLKAKSSETGQEMQLGRRYAGQQLLIDRRQYAKFYMEFADIVVKTSISTPGIKVLFYIIKKLKPGSDIVQFTIKSAKANIGYQRDKSVYEGLVELIKLGVIARKEGSEEQFFINPQYIFRGKREKLLINDTEGEGTDD